MPPDSLSRDQGSITISSPNVTVNQGPLAFRRTPDRSASCTDLVVADAATVGFSNVMPGSTLPIWRGRWRSMRRGDE